MNEPLLQVTDLKQYFPISRSYTVKAVNGVSFCIYPGETYGLVGESGSGKTTIGRSIIRLYTPTSGSVRFQGKEIGGRLDASTREMLRADMQMIFQDPMASLNPRKKVEDIIAEGLDIHHRAAGRQERSELVGELLKKVGLSPEHAERYPHQFSGGQRQRVGIARALIMNPKLIIADECISALDVSIQAQVVNLLEDLQKEMGLKCVEVGEGTIEVTIFCWERIAECFQFLCWLFGRIINLFEVYPDFLRVLSFYLFFVCGIQFCFSIHPKFGPIQHHAHIAFTKLLIIFFLLVFLVHRGIQTFPFHGNYLNAHFFQSSTQLVGQRSH